MTGQRHRAEFPDLADHLLNIRDIPLEKHAKARHDLLKYCKLDTYAMVKVWEELVRVSK